MKCFIFRSLLTCIFLVLGFSPTIHAQMLSGRVYEGNFPSEPPTAQGLADVTVTLYGSNNSGQRGTYITSTTTGSDGWYGLEAEAGFEFYTIVSGGKAGYSFQGSISVSGAESGEEIVYVAPLAGKTLTGNKYWYKSDTPQPPVNNPPVADAGGPYSTQVHEPIQLDGSGSYDPDTGDSITGYQWYWFYQGNYIPINGVQTTPTIWWVPPVVGQSTLQLEVTDSHGESDTDTATVDVQEEEPPAGTGALGGYKRDAETEAGLENWRIFIDFNGNGQWDEGEPYDMTDSTGYYQITDIEPGAYRVCEEMQPGWQGDHPCVEGVTILEGTITVQDFHNRRTQPPQGTGSIRGSKYNDLNGNGQRDPGEPGLADWQITLTDDDGTVIAIATTGANGNYEFGNVEPGTYNIDEIQQSGWRKTDPEVDGQPALWSIGLEPDSIVDGVDFGNIRDDSPPGQDYEEEHGDAPEPYFDFYLSVSSSVFLGSSVDGEPTMQRDPHALGDDNNDGSDDEDGVEFVTSLIPGQQATIRIDLTNTTGGSFGVSGHIDFDQNGNWDTGESVIQHPLTGGIVNTLTFTVPATAQSGVTFARFFIVDQGPEPPWGIPGGEVEDYEVVIGGDEPDPDSNVDVFGMCLYAEIDIAGIGLIKANLYGPVTQRNTAGTYGAAADSDADGLDDVSIELTDLNLTANDPIVGNVKMTLTAGKQTTGRIEEQANNNPGQLEVSPQTANAFIDLFFDIELPDLGLCFRAGQAIRVQGALSHAPPASSNVYSANLATPVSLYKGPCGMAWPVNTSDPPDGILHTLTACDSGVPDGRYDFGDAPDSYGTLQGSGGPYHDIGQVLMGNLVDGETDGKPRMLADGDDNDMSADEDGVSFPLDLQVGQFATVLVNATAPTGVPLAVAGWIDYDQSGTFEDPQERYVVINYTGAGAGVPVPLTETIKVPSDAKTGWTYTRFRIYRTEIGVDVLPSPTGPGGEGEVEDYRVEIKPRDDTPGDPDGGSVTIVKKATPADDTRFSFCANFAPGGFFNVLCQDLQDPADPQWILSDPSLLEKVTETVPVGWTLRNIVVSGDTDLGSTVDLSKGSVDVDYDPGENIVLVFENEKITSGDLDFGDAPASYGSAWNVLDDSLTMGLTIDAETAANYSSDATGDDLHQSDDEDGVTLSSPLTRGGLVEACVDIHNRGATGRNVVVGGWIDFNRNGMWDLVPETIGTRNVHAPPHSIVRECISFVVPQNALLGNTIARFRLLEDIISPGVTLIALPTSGGGRGEVEDYQVEISETGGPGIPAGVGDFVWNDVNRNGLQDPGEPGIANVWVDIHDQNGIPWQGTATGASGKYTIMNLPPGLYYLDFQLPAGYTFTGMAQGGDPTIDSDADPTGRTNIFAVSGGLLNQDIDAGMYRSDGAGEIRGVKWNDLNGNRMRDAGEPGLANWTMWIDLNGNGAKDSGEETLTNPDGSFFFTALSPGTYTIHEEMQSGWVQTHPGGSGIHTITVQAGQATASVAFGNRRTGSGGSFPGTVHGYKWNDLNANGIYDVGEEWLAGWTFWLDTNRNGTQDSGDRQTQTDATGHFRFANVPVGTYTLGEQLQTGWVQTTPGGAGTYSVTVQSGQGTFPMMFGNRQTGGGAGQELDWGDAPDPSYPTLEDSGGASHTIVDGFHLGASIDPEPNGRPSTDARGDDMQGIYDEDGVFFLTPLMPGQPAMVEIVASAEGLLDAWIDFDADGDWSQAHDRIFTSRAVQSGSNVLEFQVPRGTILDVDTYSRFRFSSGGALDPDGPSADGEVEDYHIVLGPEGPGIPGEFDVPHVKWSQPAIEIDPNPEESPVFCGYGEPATSTEKPGQRRQWRMVVDDFRCVGPIPVTRIRWWGSYEAWVSPEPPEMQPIAWHIGFWANMVEGLQSDELYPERLVWAVEVPPERIHSEPVGFSEFAQRPLNMCFFYELALEPEEWFHQAEFESNESIFWISITAIYPPDVDQVNMWGWSTRPHVWGRGAMMPAIMGEWPDPEERLFPGRIYPVENAQLCGENQEYDLCFELLTEQPWNMWNQPFVGLRQWPFCKDQESFAVEDEDGNMQIQRRVADDWLCERPDPIIAVSWRGSYIGYGYEACKCDQMDRPRRPDHFILSLRTIKEDPANGSVSSELAWEYHTDDYDEVLVGYDCNPEGEPNEAVFQYSVRLPEDAWFSGLVEQEYWLGIVAVYGARLDEIEQPWGWTNRPHMYGSPAHSVSFTNDGPSREPLYDRVGEPVDMSFNIFTVPVSPSQGGRVRYSRSTDGGATFEPAAKIGGAPAGTAQINPGVAVDDQGLIHVVWEDYSEHPSLGNIMYSNSIDGGRTFGEGVMVDNPITVSTHQVRPQIVVDNDRNIHVVWEDYRRDPRLGDIYYSKSTDGGRTFSDDVLVDDPITVTTRQTNPAMVVDSRGGIHIVWEDFRDNAEMANIYYATSTDGGQTFGADKRLNEVFDHATHHGRPTIVADSSDTLYAFWEDYRNASHLGDIYCSVSADGGATFGSSVMVDDPITVSSRQIRPAAAVDGNGIVYVVWEDYRDDAVRGNIYSARSLDGGRSFKKDVMVDSPFTTSTHQANPALAVTESGLVRIVWEDYRVLSEPANIYHSASLDNGKTFSEDQPAGGPASATGPRLNPAIAVDAKGVVHLVYQQ